MLKNVCVLFLLNSAQDLFSKKVHIHQIMCLKEKKNNHVLFTSHKEKWNNFLECPEKFWPHEYSEEMFSYLKVGLGDV